MIRFCLLTNDDGPSELLQTTIGILQPLAKELFTIIPSHNRTACSAAITNGTPVRIKFDPVNRIWLVRGFPADGVRYALHRMLRTKPTVLVSGINNDFNLGRCVVNSGTIGAAMEGTRCGISALCLSAKRDIPVITDTWKNAVQLLVKDCLAILTNLSASTLILNINLPGTIKGKELKGVFLPVSLASYEEYYEERKMDGRLEILRRGKHWIGDPSIPDLKLLEKGKAVINILPSPWTSNTDRVVRFLTERFPHS